MVSTLNRKRLCIAVLLFVIAVIYLLRIPGYLTLENIKIHKEMLRSLVLHNYFLSVLIYMLTYTSLVALALPAAGIMTIGGGAFFGILPTTIFVCCAATTGAVIAFITARYILRDVIEKKYGGYVASFNKAFKKNGSSYMLALMLIPVMPFFIINPLAGLTQLTLWTFIWTTAIGILPGTSVFAAAGQQLVLLENVSDILSFKTMLILILFACLSMLPIFFNKDQKAL